MVGLFVCICAAAFATRQSRYLASGKQMAQRYCDLHLMLEPELELVTRDLERACYVHWLGTMTDDGRFDPVIEIQLCQASSLCWRPKFWWNQSIKLWLVTNCSTVQRHVLDT